MIDQPAQQPPYEPTLPNALWEVVQRCPDNVFLLEGDKKTTYRQAERESARLAAGLLALGIGKAGRVGILMPNAPEWVLCWLAAARIGAFTIPLSTLFQAPELASLLRQTDIDTLLISARYLNHDYVERLELAIPELKEAKGVDLRLPSVPYLRRIIVWGECDRPWAMKGPDDLNRLGQTFGADQDTFLRAIEASITPADLLIGICTSGSTREPKVVMHTHGNAIRTTHAQLPYVDIRESDRCYSGMAFFWIGGIQQNVLSVLYRGACLVFSPSPKPDDVLDLLVREHVERIGMFPPQVAALRQRAVARNVDLSFIRWGYEPRDVNGNIVPPKNRSHRMGMTETFGPHNMSDVGKPVAEHNAGAWGHGIQGIERRVVDPATGEVLPRGKPGELQLRGFSMMAGYYKRERADTFTPDGWFPTGDEVVINDEGYLFYRGRYSEMIKTSGANVSPPEVEAVMSADPEVSEAVVFGVPDEEKGEIVVAVIVPRGGKEPDTAALRARLLKQLSSYKVPQQIHVMAYDAVPRTPSSKPRKGPLRDLLQAAGKLK